MSNEIKNIKLWEKKELQIIKEYTSSLFSKRSKFLYYKENKWNFLSNLDKKENSLEENELELTIDKTILHSVIFKQDTFTKLMFKYFSELIIKDGLIILGRLNKYINYVEKLFKGKDTQVESEWDVESQNSLILPFPSLDTVIESLEMDKDNVVTKNKIKIHLPSLIKSQVSFIEVKQDMFQDLTFKPIRLPFIESLNTVSMSYDKKQTNTNCTAIVTISGSILYYEFYYENESLTVKSIQPLYFLLI